MALFKYYPPERASLLKNRQVRFSPATEFNDPFDGVPVLKNFDADSLNLKRYEESMAREYQRHLAATPGTSIVLSEFKARYPFQKFVEIQRTRMPKYVEQFYSGYRRYLETVGILCLCKTGNSAAMWAHYAKNQSGFLVEFDDTHEFFQQFKKPALGRWIDVKYEPARPIWDYESQDGHDAFAFKSPEWAYEKEVRLIRLFDRLPRGESDLRGKPCLFAVPSAAFVSVTIGSNTSDKTWTDLDGALAGNEFHHVIRMHTSLDAESYSIERKLGWG